MQAVQPRIRPHEGGPFAARSSLDNTRAGTQGHETAAKFYSARRTRQHEAERQVVRGAPGDHRRRGGRAGGLEQGAHARQRRDGDQVADQLDREPDAEAHLRVSQRYGTVSGWSAGFNCQTSGRPSMNCRSPREAA